MAAPKTARSAAAAAPDVVTSAGVVVDFTPTGSPNTYRLAAPNFGQAGRILAALVHRHRPSDAVRHEAIRVALREAVPDRADELCAAIDAFEEADDALQATYSAFGRDDKAAVHEATLALLRAQRGRDRAEALVWDHPALAALREDRAAADHAEARLLARNCLRGWSGPALPAFAADAEGGLVPDALLDGLPAHEVGAIAGRINGLTRPTEAAAKN